MNFTVRGDTQPKSTVDATEPFEFFSLFLSTGLVTEIVKQTNLYARQLLNSDSMKTHLAAHPYSRFHRWSDVDSTELRKYLGLLFAMGVVKIHTATWHKEDLR